MILRSLTNIDHIETYQMSNPNLIAKILIFRRLVAEIEVSKHVDAARITGAESTDEHPLSRPIMTAEQPTEVSPNESIGPVQVSRRTLAKLAGMAGVTVMTGGQMNAVAADEHDQVTITMNLKPTFDRVLIQEAEDEDQTASEVLRGNNAEYLHGIVRATGVVEFVSEGDVVLYFDNGVEVLIGGEEHHLVEEPDILSVVED